MDVHVRKLAEGQRDLVAAWQLRRLGWSWDRVRWCSADWRAVHSGVYAVGYAPLSREQKRMAATLTAPHSFLCRFSAGAHYGIWSFDAGYETIVRPGNRGWERSDGVLVRYSKTLKGNVCKYDGIPITSPGRTLIDLAAHADPARPLREARRLKLVTPYLLNRALLRHSGRRGTARLKYLNDHYAGIPYSRCRSDAEAKGLEVVHDAGIALPRVNEEQAEEEADFTYPERKLIIEIDGPQFHQISAEDRRKQTIWENAGYTVRRLTSDDVYDRPELLIRAATAPVSPAG